MRFLALFSLIFAIIALALSLALSYGATIPRYEKAGEFVVNFYTENLENNANHKQRNRTGQTYRCRV